MHLNYVKWSSQKLSFLMHGRIYPLKESNCVTEAFAEFKKLNMRSILYFINNSLWVGKETKYLKTILTVKRLVLLVTLTSFKVYFIIAN